MNMKFTVDKNKFSEAIINASKATTHSSPIPALEGILMSLKDSKLTVTGYDLEMGIKSSLEVEKAFGGGDIVVNAKVFGDMVRKMPSNTDVVIEVTNDNNVFMNCGDIELNVVGIDGNEYPNIPELNLQTSFNLKENVLKSMIRQTIHAVSNSDDKPIQKGSLFEIVDNVLNVVSVDGVRVAKRTEPVNYSDIKFVTPSKTLNELLRILSDDVDNAKDITICIDNNQISFSRDDYMIISRLLEGDFFEYRKVIAFPAKSTATVSAREFVASLDRSLLLVSDKFKSPVVCNFADDKLLIKCKTGLGKINEKLTVKYDGEPIELAFNARYLIDAIKNSECDEVKIDFTTSVSPVRIMQPQGEEYSAIVLPVRQSK